MISNIRKLTLLLTAFILLLLPWFLQNSSEEIRPVLIDKEGTAFYQTNTCEFTLFDILGKNISNEEISNHTVSWFVLDDERYKELIKVDFRIKELRAGMDFTSPSITEERKKLIAKELIKRIDEILN